MGKTREWYDSDCVLGLTNLNTSRENLLRNQYLTTDNLQSRIRIHTLYKTNPYNWFRWVFDHFPKFRSLTILELGGGPGTLWVENQDRLYPNWSIYLSDLSFGMVKAVKNKLEKFSNTNYQIVDAQAIPFPESCFDFVVANHMFYHIVDKETALYEIRRVLKPGGILFAATNGIGHMKEVYTLGQKLIPNIFELLEKKFNLKGFSLDNGAQVLSPLFNSVEMDRYIDSLAVSEAEPLVDYILSMVDRGNFNLTSERIEEFTSELRTIISENGPIQVEKSTGLFTAKKV